MKGVDGCVRLSCDHYGPLTHDQDVSVGDRVYCSVCASRQRFVVQIAAWVPQAAAGRGPHGFIPRSGFGGNRTCVCGESFDKHKVVAQ